MPKCGNCKADHASVQEVKDCYNLGSPASSQEVALAQIPNGGATYKQEVFLRKLVAERQHGWENPEQVITGLLTDRKATSAAIDKLLVAEKVQGKGAGATQLHPDLEDGVYRNPDGKFVKVYHAIHGSGQQVSKFLLVTENEDGTFSGEWDYMGKRGLKGLVPAHKLTQEQAKEFGLVYGMCVRCGRDLTREESIHVGYGKTCAGHEGWWYPTKTELKALSTTAAA